MTMVGRCMGEVTLVDWVACGVITTMLPACMRVHTQELTLLANTSSHCTAVRHISELRRSQAPVQVLW
jgi:hypothetical protein